jgi:hypothetical protein
MKPTLQTIGVLVRFRLICSSVNNSSGITIVDPYPSWFVAGRGHELPNVAECAIFRTTPVRTAAGCAIFRSFSCRFRSAISVSVSVDLFWAMVNG